MVTVGGQPAQSAADWVLTTTRSVRKGLDTTREVPRELIEDCLRVAMQAPVGSNAVVSPLRRGDRPGQADCSGRVLQASLGRLPARACFGGLTSTFEDPIHEAQMPRVIASAAYLAEHLADVPALVIPCITPRVDGLPLWVQAAIWGSVLPQSWSFMLAARARGLASAWTTLHLAVRGRGGGGPGHQSRRGAAGCDDPGGVFAAGGFQARVP